jgi:DNA-directed RNA polymerase specialized sigma24 family protein
VIVASILRHVPPEMQDAAIYFFVDEITYDEIARVTGMSRRTVGNRLAAFRARVNELVWEHAGDRRAGAA